MGKIISMNVSVHPHHILECEVYEETFLAGDLELIPTIK